MTEDRFEEFVREAAADYRMPARVPREEMWARIQEARRFQRRGQARGVTHPRWWMWGAAVAAMLAVGIGIGRMMERAGGADQVATREPSASPRAPAADLPYRLATIQHLSQAEALLTSYRSGGSGQDAEIRAWAADLLTSTRLLLDSPAARDPKSQALLQDLELVLVQIAQLPARDDRQDRQIIDQALEQNDVLPRLRAAVPSGPVRPRT